MSVNYEPIKTKRTYEIIADLIKKKIFSGQYQVGDRLPGERDLAALIEVSRNAVREAYHALELSGVVEIRRGIDGGAFIKDPNHKPITQSISDLLFLRKINLEDITGARLLLEKGMAELAIQQITDEDLSELKDWVDKAAAKLKAGIPAHDENVQFHIRLCQTARNPLLTMVYSSVMELLLLILKILPAKFEASRIVTEEHKKIITLLRAGRLDPLSAYLDQHIHEANNRLLTQLAKISNNKPILSSKHVSELTQTFIEQSS